MPIYVGLGNWTDQGTKDFRGAVQRGNSFREAVEQAGGRVRELVWTMGEYDFITVLEAPDDETAAVLVLQVAAVGNVRTKTMRAFDADQMSDIIAEQAKADGWPGAGRPADCAAPPASTSRRLQASPELVGGVAHSVRNYEQESDRP
jgi:uncharacterized protein with GYD domain